MIVSVRVRALVNATDSLDTVALALPPQLALERDEVLLGPRSRYSADSSYSPVTEGLVYTSTPEHPFFLIA